MSDLTVNLKLSMREYNMLREGLDSATNELERQVQQSHDLDHTAENIAARRKVKEKIAELELFKGKLDA